MREADIKVLQQEQRGALLRKRKVFENEPKRRKARNGPSPNHDSIRDGIRHYNIRFCHGARYQPGYPGLQDTTGCPFADSLFSLPSPNVTNSSICQFVVIRGAGEVPPGGPISGGTLPGVGAD